MREGNGQSSQERDRKRRKKGKAKWHWAGEVGVMRPSCGYCTFVRLDGRVGGCARLCGLEGVSAEEQTRAVDDDWKGGRHLGLDSRIQCE